MRIRIFASIGFAGASHEGEVEIDAEDIEGMTEDQQDEYFHDIAWEQGSQYLDTWYEIVEN